MPGGRLSAGDLWKLGRLAQAYGSGGLRLTQGKHVVVVDVPGTRLDRLLAEPLLERLPHEPATAAAWFLTCPGKPFCSRACIETGPGLLDLLGRLAAALPARARPLRLHVSACEAGCGQHLVADMGLVARPVGKGDKAVVLDVYVGGCSDGEPRLARLVRASVPLDRVGDVLPALALRALPQEEPEPPAAPPLLLHHLLTFCRAAEYRSLTRAAEALALFQPVASKHLLALEAALGVPLMDRGAGGCRLTEAGRVAYRHARHILAACARLLRELDGFQRQGGIARPQHAQLRCRDTGLSLGAHRWFRQRCATSFSRRWTYLSAAMAAMAPSAAATTACLTVARRTSPAAKTPATGVAISSSVWT